MITSPVALNTKQLLLQLIFSLSVLLSSMNCQQQQQQFPTTTSSESTSLVSADENSSSLPKTTLKNSLMEASSCGVNGNTDTICSPKVGEVWQNGTWYPIIWNSMHPAYVSSPTIDIHIYFVWNYETILIKTLPNVDVAKGTVPVLVDDTWRLDPSAETYESMIYIVSSGVDAEGEMYNRNSDFPPPISNFVKQPELKPTASSSSLVASTASATSTLSSESFVTPVGTPPSLSDAYPLNDKHVSLENSGSKENSKPLPSWLIAVIALAACTVVGACTFAFWFIRRSKQRKLVYGEKGNLGSENTLNSSVYPSRTTDANGDNGEKNTGCDRSNMILNHHHLNSSMILSHPDITTLAETPASLSPSRSYYTAPQYHPSKLSGTFNNITSNDSSIRHLDAWNGPQSSNSVSNLSSRSDPPPLISSTDAIMIADTFRQRMRRPEWQQQQQSQMMSKEEEEEEKRRKLSEQLMKEELEAEGTLMKKVGKRAQLTPSIYQPQ